MLGIRNDRDDIRLVSLYTALAFQVFFFTSPIILLTKACRQSRYDNVPCLLFVCNIVSGLSTAFYILSQYEETFEQFISVVVYGLGAIVSYLYLLVFALIGNVSKCRKFLEFIFLGALTFLSYYLCDMTEVYNDDRVLRNIALVSTGLVYIFQGQKTVKKILNLVPSLL